MDYSICRRQMSSLYVIEVECSILGIKHLFQNGRLLLTCTVFTDSYNWWPRRFWSHTQPSVLPVHHHSVVPIRTNISRRFFSGFVLLCCCWSAAPATVIPWHSSFSWLFPKIRRNWRLFIASFASLLSLQYSFVASQCLRFRYFRKFVGFDVIYLTVRFVSCFLCCCRVSLQPQFHTSFS